MKISKAKQMAANLLRAYDWAGPMSAYRYSSLSGVQVQIELHEGCAVVSIPGTNQLTDWLINLDYAQTDGWHRGFWRAASEIKKFVQGVLDGYTGPKFICGHSLGAAVAGVLSHRFLTFDEVYLFGCPRFCSLDAVCNSNVPYTYNIRNGCDPVSLVPFKWMPPNYHYIHVGVIYQIGMNPVVAWWDAIRRRGVQSLNYHMMEKYYEELS